MSRGVVVGCDQGQEWMLPWWWSHFKAHNTLPVAFIDFGMTSNAKQWCRAHGRLLPFQAPQQFVASRHEITAERRADWERRYGLHLWSMRHCWFYKPFALLQTPFKETIWMDLDCEILGSVLPLFHKLHPYSQLAIACDNREPPGEGGYNSGVVVYQMKSPLLVLWAEAALYQNHLFLKDHDLLSHLIQEQEIEINELPHQYNWIVNKGIHPEAVILHWAGLWGKQVIRSHITRQEDHGKSGLAGDPAEFQRGNEKAT